MPKITINIAFHSKSLVVAIVNNIDKMTLFTSDTCHKSHLMYVTYKSEIHLTFYSRKYFVKDRFIINYK